MLDLRYVVTVEVVWEKNVHRWENKNVKKAFKDWFSHSTFSEILIYHYCVNLLESEAANEMTTRGQSFYRIFMSLF